MRGNHLFGIFSPETLQKVIPPHRAPGVQGGAQMRGNHLFGIFSLEQLKKVIPTQRAPAPPHLKALWCRPGKPPSSLAKEQRARLTSDPEASFIHTRRGKFFFSLLETCTPLEAVEGLGGSWRLLQALGGTLEAPGSRTSPDAGAPGVQGGAQMRGITFSAYSALKSSKR